MIKTILAPLAVVATLFGGAAIAGEGYINGFYTIGNDNGPGAMDSLTVDGPRGIESVSVKCHGYDNYSFNSYGPNSKGFVDGIAATWCRNY